MIVLLLKLLLKRQKNNQTIITISRMFGTEVLLFLKSQKNRDTHFFIFFTDTSSSPSPPAFQQQP